MQSLLQDLRYALRQLVRNPGFAAVAVLTLALGIGANTAIFSVIDSILLQPLPFPQAGKLVELVDIEGCPPAPPLPQGLDSRVPAPRHYLLVDLRVYAKRRIQRGRGGRVRPGVSAARSAPICSTLSECAPLSAASFARRKKSLARTASSCSVTATGNNTLAAIRMWWGKIFCSMGSIARLLGSPRKASSFPTPKPSFGCRSPSRPATLTDLWADFGFRAIGRLKDGVQPSLAQAELRSFHAQMLTLFPWIMPDSWAANMTAVPMLQAVVGDTRPKLLLLLGAVGLVLLIACANVANLMLARAASRQREMALRSALGADSRRLVRQLLTESGVLALLSGIMGVIFAAVGLQALKLALPPDTPRLENIALHGGVLLFAAGVSLARRSTVRACPRLERRKSRPARVAQTERDQCLWDGAPFPRLPPAGRWPDRAGGSRHHRRRRDAAQLVAALQHRSRIPHRPHRQRADFARPQRLRQTQAPAPPSIRTCSTARRACRA